MNYKKIYDDLILKAKSDNRKKLKRDSKLYIYYENHHIIPKSLGGNNSKENLVLLKGREHFIAHKLLVEIYPNDKKLIYGVWRMVYTNNKFQNKDYIVSSREFERVRTEMGLVQSKLMKGKFIGELHPQYGKPSPFKDKHHTKEVIDKIREIKTGTHASQKTKDLLSFQKSGDKHPMWNKNQKEETKLKIKLANTGKKQSKETCKKKSNSRKGKKPVLYLIICSHCKFEGKGPGMKMFHGDNCKQNPNYIQKEKLVIICPHCGLTGSNFSAMKGYHFDKCKQNPNRNEDK